MNKEERSFLGVLEELVALFFRQLINYDLKLIGF